MTEPAPQTVTDTAAHGMDTVLKVGTNDVSEWTKTSTLELAPDVHDISGYGMRSKRKRGGQLDNSFTASGWYDTTATTGPGAVLRAVCGTTVSMTRMLEGTGTGKPSDAWDAVVGKYSETAPCDDIVTWSCDFDITGDVVTTAQTLASDDEVRA